MTKANIKILIDRLNEVYPNSGCSLNFKNEWQLLVATILSAQCTDERVNKVTEKLFDKYKTISDFANANLLDFEQDIYSTGFYKNKAKNILATANIVHDEYEDVLPRTIDELIKLPGVGRKTANVVRGNIFNEQAIVVDTHVKRISNRLGLTKSLDPVKAEYELMKVLPEETWTKYNHQIIDHGRAICTSQKPKCEICHLRDICKHGKSLKI
ncbi:MAG: endonuclease III [Clostridia bacterium]|jgi:endonuclease-3|nr:endonuclease III [Clostridia bacterium]